MNPLALRQIARVIGAEVTGDGKTTPHVTRVVIDSRDVRSTEPEPSRSAAPANRRFVRGGNAAARGEESVVRGAKPRSAGQLFWGLRGSRCDGGAFAADACRRGAAAAVVNRETRVSGTAPELLPLLRVRDTQEALQEFARWYRARVSARVVGVTGSVGKTTTREMIHAALSAALPGTRSQRNYNNHIGVPLSVLDIDRRHVYAVVELGANHVGEIRELAGLCRPEIGVLTAVAPAHLVGFGGIEAVARAKAELLEALPPDGVAVLAGDDPRVARLRDRATCRAVFVGEREHNDVRAAGVAAANDRLDFSVAGQRFRMPVAGRHHLTAALCAVATAREFGIADRATAAALAEFVPPAGRCRVLRCGGIVLIDDAYNASPHAMHAAVALLASWRPASRRILVAGDMRELGESARRCHEELGRLAAEAGIDRLIACGEYAETIAEAARAAGMREEHARPVRGVDEAACIARAWLTPGSVLLAKGSRAVGLERLVEELRAAGGVQC